MRTTLKFRGKSVSEDNKGQWIYGNLIVDGNNAFIVNGVIECNEQYISIKEWCPVELKTVGQSTGAFDKNGRELFEDDIVKRLPCPHHKMNFTELIEVVMRVKSSLMLGEKINSNYAYLDLSNPFARSELIEVIGNIHDNPSLLDD